MGSPEKVVGLSTGQLERVIGQVIEGRDVLMEVVAPVRFAYRAVYDADQKLTYEAWGLPQAAEGDTAWMICRHTYDANGNKTAIEWASNGYTQTWSGYALLTYS